MDEAARDMVASKLMTARPRTLLLCGDGVYQRDLATCLSQRHNLVGILRVQLRGGRESLLQRARRLLRPSRLLRQSIARVSMHASRVRARSLFETLFCRDGRFPTYPEHVPATTVGDVNSPEAVTFVRNYAPDIIAVNGTNLLRKPMLDLLPEIRHGIINLHTGLSPYTRGGNCNLYALLEGHPEWVGATIHHIDAGIDSGDLIRTAQIPMQPDDLYEHIDIRTFRLGNDLLVDSLDAVAEGSAPRVRQWMPGRLYLKRTGFVYEPWHWYQVNQMLKGGLLRRYLAEPNKSGREVVLVQ